MRLNMKIRMRNNTRFKFLLATCVLCLATFFGCGYDREVEIVKNTIRKYNKTLIDVYRDLKTDYLFGVASPMEIGHVEVAVTDFKAKNLFMETEIKSIEFVKIDKRKNTEMDVETKEKWRFRHLMLGTNKEVRPWKDIEYNMIYHMINEKGVWLVNRVEFAKDVKKDKK